MLLLLLRYASSAYTPDRFDRPTAHSGTNTTMARRWTYRP